MPRAPRLRVRRLPRIATNDCSAAPYLSRLGSCRALRTSAAEGTYPAASGLEPGDLSADAVFDGDTCHLWSSGGPPPQAVRADIDDDAPVAGVLLVPEMTPDGRVVHVLELDGVSFVAEASFSSQQAHFVVFDRPVRTRSLTVRTTTSPSWVAWRDIIPFTCDALTVPDDATETSPETPRPSPRPKVEFIDVRVPGRGACATDDDCVPASCCHPKTCTAKSLAPACQGVGCAQNVVQGTIGQGARCACVQGRCGALRRERPPPPGGLGISF